MLSAQQARARTEPVAGIQRQVDAALDGFRAEQAVRTEAFRKVAREGNALVSLQQHRGVKLAKLVAAPFKVSFVIDPDATDVAATAARVQANNIDAIAAAAARSRDSMAKTLTYSCRRRLHAARC